VLETGLVHRGAHDLEAVAARRIRHGRTPDPVILDHDLERSVGVVDDQTDRPGEASIAVLDRVVARLGDREHRVLALVKKKDRGETIEVTVSIGATRSQSLAGEFDGLLTTADRVLYAAKRGGRNRVCLASEEHDTQDDLISDTTTLGLARAMAYVGAPLHSPAYSHLAEVAQLATRIARQLACPPQQVLRCRLAGLVHEVGKTQMQARLQSQPDPSEPTKTDDITAHPTVGEAIINSVPDLRPIAPIVRQQHEHYDGTGHPDGLTGDSIALEARIIAAANAWSAMTRARTDRHALSPADALPKLDRLSGTTLDPRVVQALKTALADMREDPPLGQQSRGGPGPAGRRALGR